MKKRVGKLFLSILISLIAMIAFGQTGLLRYADKQFDLENYAKAVEAYKDANGQSF